MKLVKEYINEKFVEDSDPIKDLDIGYKEIFDTQKYIKNAERIMKKRLKEEQKTYEQKIKEKLIGKIIVGNFLSTTVYNTLNNRTKKNIC